MKLYAPEVPVKIGTLLDWVTVLSVTEHVYDHEPHEIHLDTDQGKVILELDPNEVRALSRIINRMHGLVETK